MLDDVIRYLACPQCGAGLGRAGGVLRCPAGHSFDIARQGYVSLLPPGGTAPSGDSPAMVAARAGFLPHYAGLAAELAAAARDLVIATGAPGCVLDVGAGPGFYLAAVLDRLPDRAGLAVDVSRAALRLAARAHPRIGAVAADAWRRLPVADGAAAAALNVFAPRNGPELRRVLHPRGRLLVVTPNAGHLAELAGPLGLLSVDPRKDERLARTLGPAFELVEQRRREQCLQLDHQAAAAAAGMGPSAWHTDPAALAGLIGELPGRVTATLSVTLSVFRPVPADDGDPAGR
jgi:23S rRNA (guanine745-N1)-methyltransferase